MLPVVPLILARAPLASFFGAPTCADGASVGASADGSVVRAGSLFTDADVFTNHGAYMPRVRCMQTAEGGPDWFWIVLLVAVMLGIAAWYVRIYWFWRQCYLAEREEDRNPRMMELANIFFWCAVCGYLMSVVMFVWPAYRLLAIFLIVLNVWSWRFVMRIKDFRIALQAKRLERELRESLESRNEELERQVAARTAALEEAQRVAEAAQHAAEEANRAKSEFLANMSHEIRTPLNSILGFTNVLEEDADDALARAAHLDTIRRNGDHLLTVISDVLDLSKIEAGQMEVERVRTGVGELLLDLHAIMHERATARGNTLEVELATPVPRHIETDPTRLRQVLINLVGNAIKFTEGGYVRIAASVEGGAMVFEVRDTGVGMTQEQAARIFEPFRQADGSTTRRFGGTGLGLTISRQLAQRLGGWLEATGAPGEGSVFTLRIDPGDIAGEEHVTRLEREAAPEAAAEKGAPLDARVLLAEDGADNRRLIAYLLRGAGVELVMVENGQEAVEAVEREARTDSAFDLVLMDMQMPVMDGLRATEVLRARGHTLPIVALTANALSSDRQRCLARGFDDYLTKPANRADIVGAIRAQLERGGRSAA